MRIPNIPPPKIENKITTNKFSPNAIFSEGTLNKLEQVITVNEATELKVPVHHPIKWACINKAWLISKILLLKIVNKMVLLITGCMQIIEKKHIVRGIIIKIKKSGMFWILNISKDKLLFSALVIRNPIIIAKLIITISSMFFLIEEIVFVKMNFNSIGVRKKYKTIKIGIIRITADKAVKLKIRAKTTIMDIITNRYIKIGLKQFNEALNKL